MRNVHPYFPLKNVGKKCPLYTAKCRYPDMELLRPSLSLLVFNKAFVLKSVLSGVSIATQALFCLFPLSWSVLFHPFTSVFVCLSV